MPVSGISWKPWRVVLALAVVAALASQVEAQRRRSFGSTRIATANDFDGTFQFCRVAFASDGRGDGGGWSADFPRADINLSIRLSELTKTRVGRDSYDEPTHLLDSAHRSRALRLPVHHDDGGRRRLLPRR